MEKRIQLSTIIVSTEKRTNYIKECLQSLLVQKTDVIFEIILVLSKDHDSNFTFVDRKKEYLTEKQRIEDAPLVLDIDLRY